jgi:hypothetical protein
MENTKVVHNCETGEITEVEMTVDEIAQNAADGKKDQDRIAAHRANKTALLERLGLTAEEAASLLG